MSFQGKIEGVRLLKDGQVTVTLTCNGDDLQLISNSRKGTVSVYGEGEVATTDTRAEMLSRIRGLAEQVAVAIDKELNPVCEDTQTTII